VRRQCTELAGSGELGIALITAFCPVNTNCIVIDDVDDVGVGVAPTPPLDELLLFVFDVLGFSTNLR
jgi:hypothetical protein